LLAARFFKTTGWPTGFDRTMIVWWVCDERPAIVSLRGWVCLIERFCFFGLQAFRHAGFARFLATYFCQTRQK
jgi:hypothetical protein